MKTKEPILDPFPQPKECPWCHAKLEGEIMLVFRIGVFQNLYETKTFGANNYTWVHNPGGCFVPVLNRLTTPDDRAKAIAQPEAAAK
jgi:hypothetical protein